MKLLQFIKPEMNAHILGEGAGRYRNASLENNMTENANVSLIKKGVIFDQYGISEPYVFQDMDTKEKFTGLFMMTADSGVTVLKFIHDDQEQRPVLTGNYEITSREDSRAAVKFTINMYRAFPGRITKIDCKSVQNNLAPFGLVATAYGMDLSTAPMP